MDPVARQAIAILRGGKRIAKVVLLDENDVIVAIHELPTGVAYKPGEHAEITISITPSLQEESSA